jgi:galactosamine-6-phosphate isomerase
MPLLSTHLDYETLSAEAAKLIAERIEQKPSLLLCLATGSTPTRTYELLAARPKSLFNQIRILKLDEWGGIPLNSPATCETYLRKIFIDPLDLSARYTGFESQPVDPAAECSRISRWLEQNGPIDLCILGLGVNGHLGFNEPAAVLQPHAHVATLSSESLQHSMIQNLPIKPTFGLTLGISDVLNSREIILLVSGATKADPLRRMVGDIVKGAVRPSFPATCLAKHDNTIIMCDHAAAKHFL